MRYFIALCLLLATSLFQSVQPAGAAPKYLFKIASLAPEGSVWVQQFTNFTDEVTNRTNGEVVFRIYPGGIMGDDQSMYRKMRVGQLHGGGFTMTGISAIVPDFRVMAIPFLFKSYDEVDAVTQGLLPLFRQRFNDKGMELIAMTEVGFIYTMSTKPIATTAELQSSTCWAPAGDPLATTFFEQMGVTPVQLSIPDVLSSLQTGLVDTVFNSLYGSIVLQWFTKARYITDTPFGYAYGVFLFDKRQFDKLPPHHQEVIRQAAAKHFAVLMEEARTSNRESRQVMTERGVTFIEAAPSAVAEQENYRDQAVEELVGKAFSREIYQATISELQRYRAGQSGGSNQ